MFGRSARPTLALILALLAANPALAKKHDLSSGLPLGFAFVGGLERNPKSDFTLGIQHYDANSFGKYYSFEPFFDFTKFIVRATASIHSSSALHGSGSDNKGSFNEVSDASSTDYGLKLQLAPFFSQDNESRTYFSLGVSRSSAKIKTVRQYNGQSFTEQAKGTGSGVSGGIGWQTFILGNYIFEIEGGYESRTVTSFAYTSANDTAGNSRTVGDPVLKSDGTSKSIQVHGAYFQAGLILHF